MATLATQVFNDTGLEATYAAATDTGDQCVTGEGVFLHVRNGGAASHTVTLLSPQQLRGDLAVGDRDVVVPAGAQSFVAVPDFYRDPSDGLCALTYDSVEAGFELAVLRS